MLRLVRRLFMLSLKLGLLIVGIGALVGYANLADLDGWKKEIQDKIMRVSGRRLYIDGTMDFEISYPPRIIARGVRLQNAPWGKKKDMLKAKALVVEVDLLPLMLGDVAVPRLQLVGADIVVEVGKSGKTNWDDMNSFDTAAGSTPAPAGGVNVPVFNPVLSGGISVSGGTVTVSNAATGAMTTFSLPGGNVGIGGGIACF